MIQATRLALAVAMISLVPSGLQSAIAESPPHGYAANARLERVHDEHRRDGRGWRGGRDERRWRDDDRWRGPFEGPNGWRDHDRRADRRPPPPRYREGRIWSSGPPAYYEETRRIWTYGQTLPRHWTYTPWYGYADYRLPPPPIGHHYVRVDGQTLLLAAATGAIIWALLD
jgi:Ni/Co efflux regulator RcnB